MTSNRTDGRPRSLHLFGLGLPTALLCAAALLAGTAGTSVAKPAHASKAELDATCTRIADVLSDGPDPTADPVGYALAQVLPLREISTSDKVLKRDIDALASAYEVVYRTNDKKGTEAAVDKVGKRIDSICPGAF